MKKIAKYKYAFASILILLVAACDNFLDVNTDATRLKTANLTAVLTSAESSLAFYQGSDFFLYSSVFTQQASGNGVSGNQVRMMDQYIVANSDVNNAFTNYYAGTLADLDYIRKNAYSQGNPQYVGVAKILQAFTFSNLVDMWGNVPYKQALKGVGNVQPAYDDSREIYDSLFVLIDDGIADLGEKNFLAIGTDDLIYGGDISKWIKFGNTLKLRLALHYAKVDNGQILNSIINAGVPFMASNADNFQLTFDNVTNRQNPIHQFELNRVDYYWPGKFMVDLMTTKVDPRRSVYFSPFPYPAAPYTPNPATDTYKGVAPDQTQSVAYSRIYTYLRGSLLTDDGKRSGGGVNAVDLTYTGSAPIRMLTFAEYNFIRAEASLVYGGAGSAATFFKAGIDASLANAGITGAFASTYSNTQSAAPLTLQSLIEEKYVANYGVAVEPWTDWRRTGFPAISASAAAVTQGNTTIPRILVYPLSEQQVNAANVPPRASMVVKGVFWDN